MEDNGQALLLRPDAGSVALDTNAVLNGPFAADRSDAAWARSEIEAPCAPERVSFEVMHFVPASREVLAEVLLAAGPTAPTLCAGWQTRHLAAHLIIREQSLLAAGLVIKPLAHRMEAELDRRADVAGDRDAYASLVNEFLRGAPRFSPLSNPRVDHSANLSEFFIHTEDVRRASDRWVPRALDAKYEDLLWEDLVRRAAHYYRGVDVGIILVRPDGQRHVARKASTSVAITGRPGELLLHASGRREEALVTFEGAAEAIALLSVSL